VSGQSARQKEAKRLWISLMVSDVGPWGSQRGKDEPPAPTEAEWVDRIAYPGAILNPSSPVTDRLWTHRREK
jgi:hypothetical protein